MNILFCGTFPPTGYVGGRFLGWMLAEATAAAGHTVTYWTNLKPQFSNDFTAYPRHDTIKMAISPDFSTPPPGAFDIIFVITDTWRGVEYYGQVAQFSKHPGCRMVLLNCETFNWFNIGALEPRDLAVVTPSVYISTMADMIMSISQIGQEYAKQFFTSTKETCLFRCCYPPINSVVADSVVGMERKKDQIICFVRFTPLNKHKGSQEIIHILSPELAGVKLLLIVGYGEVDANIMQQIVTRAKECDVELEIAYKIRESEKFRRLKQASVLIYPSSFEGFGLPPIEAQYCGTPCVVYDLPVFREVSGDGLIYVPQGDHAALRQAIIRVMNTPLTPEERSAMRENIVQTALFSAFAERLDVLLQEVANVG